MYKVHNDTIHVIKMTLAEVPVGPIYKSMLTAFDTFVFWDIRQQKPCGSY